MEPATVTQPHDIQPPSPDGEVVFYKAPPPDDTPLEVRWERDTLWLTQRQMADLFRTSASNVSRHLGNVFDEGELDLSASSKDLLLVRTEGRRRVRRAVTHYNLDAIISVGYRVDSQGQRPDPLHRRVCQTWGIRGRRRGIAGGRHADARRALGQDQGGRPFGRSRRGATSRFGASCRTSWSSWSPSPTSIPATSGHIAESLCGSGLGDRLRHPGVRELG